VTTVKRAAGRTGVENYWWFPFCLSRNTHIRHGYIFYASFGEESFVHVKKERGDEDVGFLLGIGFIQLGKQEASSASLNWSTREVSGFLSIL